jgi:hypothetical protein
VLSRFLGLEFLKKKEETGKELYSEFNKSMMSNVYNTETLKSDIEGLQTRIEGYGVENKDLDIKILDAESRLTKGRDYKEGLISQKYNDIDHKLSIIVNFSYLLKNEMMSNLNWYYDPERSINRVKTFINKLYHGSYPNPPPNNGTMFHDELK